MQQYEKYRRVEPSERGTAMFDEMLRLKRENMILAVYHQWAEYAGEFFCNLLGKKCVSFQRILVLTVEVDNYNRKGKMNIDNDKRLIFI